MTTPANDNRDAIWQSRYVQQENGLFAVELRFGDELVRDARNVAGDRRASALAGQWLILAMRGEVATTRRESLSRALQEREERRLRRRPPQEFDTSALPLFGDGSRQMEMF